MSGRGGTAEAGQHEVADEGADHEDVALREVEQLQDSVDDREAQRDESEHAAVGQADDRRAGRTGPS